MTMIDPRERITEGLTTERLKMEAKRSIVPTLFFGLGIVVTLGILAFLISNISQTFGKETQTVRFTSPSAFGVFEGRDDVRYRGVPVGTIKKIERNGTDIVLVAELQSDVGPIYKDARAELRPITPLNDEYLDIVNPGTEQAGKADPKQPLPESQTTSSVSIPEVFDALKADERRSFHTLLDQLGNGTKDRGVALRAAFAEVVPFLQGAGKLTKQLAVRRQATKRLVHNTAVLTTELGSREAALRRLVGEGALTLGALQAGSQDLDATLRELGPTFTELRSSLASVRGVLGDVDTGLRSLTPVADSLPEGLAAVRRLNRDLKPTLVSLSPVLIPVSKYAIENTTTFRRLREASSLLRAQIPVFDKTTNVLKTCERGVIGFMIGNASLTKFGDANAPAPRGNLAFGVPTATQSGVQRVPHKSCAPGNIERGVITAAGEG